MTRRKVVAVSMFLPQNQNRSDNDRLYKNFRRRVVEKSQDNRIAQGLDPIQLILNFPGTKYGGQMGVVVQEKTFSPILDLKTGKEIGFSAMVETIPWNERKLYVYKTGKAYLEKP